MWRRRRRPPELARHCPAPRLHGLEQAGVPRQHRGLGEQPQVVEAGGEELAPHLEGEGEEEGGRSRSVRRGGEEEERKRKSRSVKRGVTPTCSPTLPLTTAPRTARYCCTAPT